MRVSLPILAGPLRGARYLPAAGGKLARLLLGRYEPELTARFVEHVRPGQIVFDLGAAAGYYTLLAARLVGASGGVVAFEPEPRNFGFLREHVRLNRLARVELHNAAVGEQRRFGELRAGPGQWDGAPRPAGQPARPDRPAGRPDRGGAPAPPSREDRRGGRRGASARRRRGPIARAGAADPLPLHARAGGPRGLLSHAAGAGLCARASRPLRCGARERAALPSALTQNAPKESLRRSVERASSRQIASPSSRAAGVASPSTWAWSSIKSARRARLPASSAGTREIAVDANRRLPQARRERDLLHDRRSARKEAPQRAVLLDAARGCAVELLAHRDEQRRPHADRRLPVTRLERGRELGRQPLHGLLEHALRLRPHASLPNKWSAARSCAFVISQPEMARIGS